MPHRCQQPAPSASPEKHHQVPARTTSLRGMVATEDTDPPNGPKRRARPRQLSAQVALAFLQLALLPQVSTGDLPLLLPPAPNLSLQRTEMPLGRNGNVKSRASLSVGVKSTRVDFSPSNFKSFDSDSQSLKYSTGTRNNLYASPTFRVME